VSAAPRRRSEPPEASVAEGRSEPSDVSAAPRRRSEPPEASVAEGKKAPSGASGPPRVSPAIKYTFGRVGLFVVIAVALLPFKLNLFLDLMIALLISMPLSYFLLRRWRNQMAEQIDRSVQRHKNEKQRLREALSGDEPADDVGAREGRANGGKAGKKAR
jgi:hypothetical protein